MNREAFALYGIKNYQAVFNLKMDNGNLLAYQKFL